ncbi:hypothetical protein MMC18_005999 [Xylographa bjoerkii]|nr:hypothetical protein [Xylographa bjoerkii]
MDRMEGRHPDVIDISDDDEIAIYRKGSQYLPNVGRPISESIESAALPIYMSNLIQTSTGNELRTPAELSITTAFARAHNFNNSFTSRYNQGANMNVHTVSGNSTAAVANYHNHGLEDLYSGRYRERQNSAVIVDLDGDGNPNRSDLTFAWDHLNTAAPDSRISPGISIQDYMSDEDFRKYIANQQKPKQRRQSKASSSLLPSVRIRHPPVAMDKYDHNGILLSVGINVELENGDFLRIVEMLNDHYSIFLRGRLFRRMKFMNGTIEKKTNEVCLIQEIDKSDARDHDVQSLEKVEITDVVKRRGLRVTNQPFPRLSFREQCSTIEKREVILNERLLVCRWKYICTFENARAFQRNAHSEKALIALRSDESDRGYSMEDDDLRTKFRGETSRGGASSMIHSVELAQIRIDKDLATRALEQPWGNRATSSVGRFSFQGPEIVDLERPGSSVDVPFDVDSPFSRMSLEPSDFWASTPIRTSKATNSTRERCSRGVLSKRPATGDPPTTSKKTAIDLTSNTTGYEKRQTIQQETNEPRRQTGSSFIERRGHGNEGPVLSKRPRLTVSRIWNVRDDSFMPEAARSNIIPTPGSPSDSDSTVTGNDSTAAANLDEVEIVSGYDPHVRRIFKLNDMLVQGPARTSESRGYNDTSYKGHNLRRYTFGDGFCGCGGVSRGATIAGLRLQWAFDFEDPMCRSYSKNFPSTKVFRLDAFDFATSQTYNARVDILHLSPPCQFFSPAHTTNGINDDRNTASSFVILELLKKTQPRIVTLENTLGLEQRHPLYLHAVIQQFTSLGFSIRWKIIDLRDYGVPQSRRRLIIIAACPGEILPDFPKPTHSKTPGTTGLKPWATINESINSIPRHWHDHDESKANQTRHQPFDGNTQAKCMTTSGGINNYHPSGRRGYTIREFACLQTFPLEHMWAPTTITQLRVQIGNAVPPIFYAALARKIVETLKKTDGLSDVIDLTEPFDEPGNGGGEGQSFVGNGSANTQPATGYRFQ